MSLTVNDNLVGLKCTFNQDKPWSHAKKLELLKTGFFTPDTDISEQELTIVDSKPIFYCRL